MNANHQGVLMSSTAVLMLSTTIPKSKKDQNQSVLIINTPRVGLILVQGLLMAIPEMTHVLSGHVE